MPSRKQRLMKSLQAERKRSSAASEKKNKRNGSKKSKNWKGKKEEEQVARESEVHKRLPTVVGQEIVVESSSLMYGGKGFVYDVMKDGRILVYSQGDQKAFPLDGPDLGKRLIDYFYNGE